MNIVNKENDTLNHYKNMIKSIYGQNLTDFKYCVLDWGKENNKPVVIDIPGDIDKKAFIQAFKECIPFLEKTRRDEKYNNKKRQREGECISWNEMQNIYNNKISLSVLYQMRTYICNKKIFN